MKKIRLDKFLSNANVLTRKECVKSIKNNEITINGVLALKKDQLINYDDIVFYKNSKVEYKQFIYLMLNKPINFVSSTDDPINKTVLDLLPTYYRKFNLFPCGRLDKDTTGLLILTNDGVASHHLLSPKYHVEKTYYFTLDKKCSNNDILKIEKGICLRDGYTTKACKIIMNDEFSGLITLTEGKYHEIKRIFGAVNNKITSLKRISFGSIVLDNNLNEGEYRPLTAKEQLLFENIK